MATCKVLNTQISDKDMENTENKQQDKLTSVHLTLEDWEFCKSQGLMFSELLRDSIRERKDRLSGIIVDNVQEIRRKLEIFIKLNTDLLNFIENRGLSEEWLQTQTP